MGQGQQKFTVEKIMISFDQIVLRAFLNVHALNFLNFNFMVN